MRTDWWYSIAHVRGVEYELRINRLGRAWLWAVKRCARRGWIWPLHRLLKLADARLTLDDDGDVSIAAPTSEPKPVGEMRQ